MKTDDAENIRVEFDEQYLTTLYRETKRSSDYCLRISQTFISDKESGVLTFQADVFDAKKPCPFDFIRLIPMQPVPKGATLVQLGRQRMKIMR